MASDYRQLSFWHDSLPGLLLPRPALSADIQADIAIVGAGYTGLWTAYYLKQIDPALNIVLLEAEVAGYGASGRNGGWCSSHISSIDSWLNDPQQKNGALRLQRLMFETVREIGEIAKRESIDCHFDQSGGLEIAVLPVQLARMQAEFQHLRSLGFGAADYRWLDAHQVRDLIHVDRALGGLLLHHCAAIHPARLARGLADCVESLGVRIYEHSPVLAIDGHELATTGGKVKAGITLLTTEGYSAGLADRARRLIPVHSMMVATEPLNQSQLDTIGLRRRVAFGNGDRVVTYGQLTADHRIAFGCRGTYLYGSGIRRQFDPADAEFDLVRNTLLRFFPALKGIRFTHAWGGAMGVSRTMQPSVNFDPARQLGWAGGYFGSGVAATHLAGQTLADLVTGQDTPRVHTPWVNPPQAGKDWEPEPWRWLGIKSVRTLMTLADEVEYRGGRMGAFLGGAINRVLP